jgi:hypothetical protein
MSFLGSTATKSPPSTPETPSGQATTQSTFKNVRNIAVVLLVTTSVVVFVWSAVATSTARVSATTGGSSFFEAGTVDLAQPGAAVELLFDASDVFPGVDTEACVEIEYRGSIPSSVRVHADRRGGDGLETFIQLHLAVLAAQDCATADEAEGDHVYDGLLSDLWSTHSNYDNAIVLDPEMEAAERLVLYAIASVVDDNSAQGLSTDFSITLEARP